MAQHISDEERELIRGAAEKLGEHFDSVQIFVSRHNDNKIGTSRFETGVGNWFSRYGQIRHWMMLQNEQDCQELRDDMNAAQLTFDCNMDVPAPSTICFSDWSGVAVELDGRAREEAAETIRRYHYTRSVPSGKSHYLRCGDAIVVWSIPANKNIAKFVLGWPGTVWELSRLWAPDGHEKNLLTRAISAAVTVIRRIENPDALVSYADPNAGHNGGVYRAASWIYHGKSEEVRTYRGPDGNTFARRSFHSGKTGMRKSQIEAMGFTQLNLPGKERFVKPLTRKARKAVAACVTWTKDELRPHS